MSYACNGSNTVFAYTFKIFADSDLVVKLRDTNGVETTLTLTTDYTVSGAGAAGGGNVTTVATYASGNQLVILRQIPITQLTDYVENDAFLAETHEAAIDRAIMLSQQLDEEVGRAIKMPDSSPLAGAALEITGGALANKVIGFDAGGTAIELKSTGTVTNPDFYVISDYTDLADAISTIGASVVTLLINSQVNVTADATIPSNIELWFLKEGSFNISAGKTVTINGGLRTGLNTIFTGSGTVAFGAGYVNQVYPNWWGAIPDDSTDSSTAFVAAVATTINVFVPANTQTTRYVVNAALVFANGQKFRGAGKGSTWIKSTYVGWLVTFGTGGSCAIEDMTIDCDETVGGNGVLFDGVVVSWWRNLEVKYCAGVGVRFIGELADFCGENFGMGMLQISGPTGGAVAGSIGLDIDGLDTNGYTNDHNFDVVDISVMETGVKVGANFRCDLTHFNSLTVQNCSGKGINLVKQQGFYVDSIWLEGNTGDNMTIADYHATNNPGDVIVRGSVDDIENSAGGVVHTLSRERRVHVEDARENRTTGITFNAMNHRRSVITYSASMTPNPLNGDTFFITITDGVAFTINAPTDITQFDGGQFNFILINSSGGAIGNVTWAANYKTEWDNGANKPANGEQVTISFAVHRSNPFLYQIGGISGSY